MPSLNVERAKKIRSELKKEFPPHKGWKINVRLDQNVNKNLNVVIMKSPLRFMDKKIDVVKVDNDSYHNGYNYRNCINDHKIDYDNINDYKNVDILRIIDNICNMFNVDNFEKYKEKIKNDDDWKFAYSMHITMIGYSHFVSPDYYTNIYISNNFELREPYKYVNYVKIYESYQHIPIGNYNKPFFMMANKLYEKEKYTMSEKIEAMGIVGKKLAEVNL